VIFKEYMGGLSPIFSSPILVWPFHGQINSIPHLYIILSNY